MAEERVSDDERPVMTVYPSIASLRAGRFLGGLYESIPFGFGTVKLSHLIFPLPTAPLALLLYAAMKIVGPRYRLSTRRLTRLHGLAMRPGETVALDRIDRIDVESSIGQWFFKAGDLIVRDRDGVAPMRLTGVVRPSMFRHTILETRDSLVRTRQVERTIAARHAVPAGGA